ncbi:hypothetical protein FPV67DRAFT_1449718 [Lyophyllum atratum]|nr:hypothetical protein FPV67DRAFT_1449718 [Lyophyllum atratum]
MAGSQYDSPYIITAYSSSSSSDSDIPTTMKATSEMLTRLATSIMQLSAVLAPSHSDSAKTALAEVNPLLFISKLWLRWRLLVTRAKGKKHLAKAEIEGPRRVGEHANWKQAGVIRAFIAHTCRSRLNAKMKIGGGNWAPASRLGSSATADNPCQGKKTRMPTEGPGGRPRSNRHPYHMKAQIGSQGQAGSNSAVDKEKLTSTNLRKVHMHTLAS